MLENARMAGILKFKMAAEKSSKIRHWLITLLLLNGNG